MNIANCPYVDGKCNAHAQCSNCTVEKTLFGFLKAKIERTYYLCFIPYEAAQRSAIDIHKWRECKLITPHEESELCQFNGELYYKHLP